jgi:transposase
MNIIGIDSHITTLDCCAVSKNGRILKEESVQTSAFKFIKFVQSIPKPRTIYVEEGNLAAWLLETAVSFGEELIITDPKRNKHIACEGEKNDKVDARKLADLARNNYIKAIHHPIGQKRRFKELVLHLYDMSKTQTRVKNKIKSIFRANGIACSGETIYNPEHRKDWLKKLPNNRILYSVIIDHWLQLDQVMSITEKIKQRIGIESRQFPETTLFKKLPGIGPIHAATFSAIIGTPHRFANKKKLWMYSGLGIISRGSGGVVYYKKLTRQFNRPLKRAIKMATESALKGDNPFKRQFIHLLSQGIPPHKAKLTVARSLLSTIYSIWKKGEKYKPKIISLPKEYETAV